MYVIRKKLFTLHYKIIFSVNNVTTLYKKTVEIFHTNRGDKHISVLTA